PTDPTMLVNWINALIYGNISSMDELRSGVVFCRMLNSLYPGCIEMESLYHHPKSMWENNYRKLKRALNDLELQPHLSVSRLMRGSPLDSTYIVHFFIDLYHVHIGLSREQNRRRKERERQLKRKAKEDPPKKEQGSSAIYDLFQWFKNVVLGYSTESGVTGLFCPVTPPTPPKVEVKPSPPKLSEEEKQRDFDRQVRLLFFEPVPFSDFEEEVARQKNEGIEYLDRRKRELEEAERRQRRKDHEQLRRLVAACLQLRDGHELMQELYLQSRRERLS
ncbi:hypothetical protein KR074_012290, partial [Drosophila pseudoananassae]